MNNKQINRYKTSDMKISKDSQGCYSVTHKYQGTLIDGNYYSTSAECRREAVNTLKDIKEGITAPSTEETVDLELNRRAKIFWQ